VAATLGTTLIFPATGPTATRYAEEARERGETVVAASSVRDDEAMQRFDIWISLPSIYAADFVQEFEQSIAAHGITRILSPVPAVYAFLRRLLAERFRGQALSLQHLRARDVDRFILREARRVSRISVKKTLAALRVNAAIPVTRTTSSESDMARGTDVVSPVTPKTLV